MNRVDGGGRNRNSLRGVQAVPQVGIGVFNHGGTAGGFGHSLVNGDHVFQAVVMGQLLQAAISPGLQLDAASIASPSQSAEKSQCLLPYPCSPVHAHLSGPGMIAPEKMSPRQ